MIVAILIGREGSTGFPGKNTHKVLGRPLASYPLMAASGVEEIDRIYVSTDSSKIVQIGEEFGARIIHRPPELCTREALSDAVFEHALEVITEELGEEPKILVLLMANAPVLTSAEIKQGIDALQKNPDLDSAVTVSIYNMWSPLRARFLSDEGLLEPSVPFEVFGDPKILNCDRDSQGDVYFANMSYSIIRPENLHNIEEGKLPQKWMGQRIYPVLQEAGLDVDYDWQVPQIEFFLRKLGYEEAE